MSAYNSVSDRRTTQSKRCNLADQTGSNAREISYDTRLETRAPEIRSNSMTKSSHGSMYSLSQNYKQN
jgi:hypothetical protein